ncbi:DUF3169 family protein [Staphylococcus edaphicus]|uniref:DUF3169 family protein n=1 Tax=Staphylococcus edaphicus TaxID=1955013 RepID=A0A2C6WHZ9_9STAP|nr:DUF3169 family protein [Staphylococcus edaphicus]PHK48740.1 hypothetical protein BTJ66_11935 [Staphylococcus edaphicus]UQW81665.1 DUF3169 family protein [Staphylococcus edaphicus]
MKVGRYLLLLLLGGIVGGFIGGMIGTFNSISKYTNILSHLTMSFNALIMLCIFASAMNIILTLVLFQVQRHALKYKRQTEQVLDEQNADYYERKANLKFISTNLIYYIQILISLVTMLIIVVSHNSEHAIFYSIIPYLITMIPSLMNGFFVRKFDTRYPKQGEEQYTEKILAMMDDGERHITLVSMFKIYQYNLVIIITGGIVLGLVSFITGVNQFPGVLILTSLFIYNAFGYKLKVRKFYK